MGQRTMDNGIKEQRTMGQRTKGQWDKGTMRDKEQWERDNKTKESNLKGTMEGLEIWYVTGGGHSRKPSKTRAVITLGSN